MIFPSLISTVFVVCLIFLNRQETQHTARQKIDIEMVSTTLLLSNIGPSIRAMTSTSQSARVNIMTISLPVGPGVMRLQVFFPITAHL